MGLSASKDLKIKENEIETLHNQNTALIENEITLYKKNEMNIPKINVLITGLRGAGKSTFLNSFFVEPKVPSGILKPVTKDISSHSDDACPLTMYDTPGIELDEKKQKILMNSIFKHIKNKYETNDCTQFIHLIFYCVSTENTTIDDKEEDFIKAFANDPCMKSIPIVMVLTQSYDEILTKNLLRRIKDLKIPNIKQIVPIVAKQREMIISGERIISKSFGKNEIIEAINSCLPIHFRELQLNYQISELLHKRWRSIYFINKATIETIENFRNLIHTHDWQKLYIIESDMQNNILSTYSDTLNPIYIILRNTINVSLSILIREIIYLTRANNNDSIIKACKLTKSFGMALISLAESTYDINLDENQLREKVISTFLYYIKKDSCMKYIYEQIQNT